ncbi:MULTISPECIES: phenylalanine--tRNA ligase subunit beta [unclassified Aureimonas]|uniref:phenylalanine--tRNA ligase subunit beta n=1 Tax=unclassified Aureimonas TaxID=2615206 RepID=UPI0006F64E73|nr:MULTISPECIES: phenylalanine--tRNA ligase subunit beta [unclassified Aureimonas]KQT64216.1 phenylalanine--tRNA ligase subunit beta [Aureimonas sp. Leaf427]KQT81406.1 phenylalanine--tRNA ligase subunit beta [Aureimonas sp. Leaf460]
MKFTLSWLKDHLDTTAPLSEIAERLTSLGLEVDGIDDKAAMRPFTIARVLSASRHPDADKLQVLSVDAGPGVNGGKPLQVVCGAPNAREGLVGVLGLPGTYVPGLDVTLGIGKIRGVESHGMMCSERELELSDEHNGIIDLPADAPVGTAFADYAGLADPVIEIGLTPNRPDATSIRGIARDLAASGLGTLKDATPDEIAGEGPSPVVRLAFDGGPSLCRGFALRLVRGVKNGPSPAWMQARLRAIGLRPINALVDVTNYLTFDRGRPLHVFDAAKVSGDLVVRAARDGETIEALDGRTYTLTSAMCVIADDKGVESLAGIMGGEASGCDEGTTDVIIESALWEPLNIARTGRALGIITDARYRFERGVDPDFMVPGLDLATRLVLELCGGTPSEKRVIEVAAVEPASIRLPFAETRRLTGLDVPRERQIEFLERLGFRVSAGEAEADVVAPSWRPDIEGKADLVEEIMRLSGVDSIEPRPLPALAGLGQRILTTSQIRERAARRSLAARGMVEAVTYSFVSGAQAKAFGGGAEALRLANPIAADLSDMRPSLLPGLIAAATRNAAKGFPDVAIFEVAHVYLSDQPEGQKRVAGGIRRGTAGPAGSGRFWNGSAEAVSVYDAKADAIAALEAAGAPVANLQIEAGASDWYHPGRSGRIKLGPKTVLAEFGEFHPKALKAMDASGAFAGFEVFLGEIPEAKRKATRTKPRLVLSPYQPVRRDYAFVVEGSVEAQKILRAAEGADRKLISEVRVFDIFTGAAIGEGRKSVAIEVTLRPLERTLTDEDLEAVSSKIVAAVSKATGGTLRA